MSTLEQRLGADLGDRFAIERELARGGMAVVYLARDLKHDRRLALKVLDPTIQTVVTGERFHREIGLLARLQHPHILPLHDSGEAAGSLFYVMPFVDGESLRHRLDREGRLPVADALRIAAEVADALAYAHAHHVVHRDVKPENILLAGYPPRPGRESGGWHALVCDFGIARLTGRDSGVRMGGPGERHTGPGMAVGTPTYMSPEQASGQDDVDARTDTYALGVVLYEMLAGVPPFTGATPRDALARRFSSPPPRAGRVRADVPRRVDAVIVRAMAPDPARRFATAAAMGEALQDCLAVTSRRGTAAGTRTRRRVALGTLAALGIAAALGARERIAERLGRPPLDPSLVAVLPFAEQDGSSAATPLDGPASEQLLYDAMARWRDVRLVDLLRVNDAQLRHGTRAPRTLAEARTIARALGAGTLAWGEVSRRPGDTVVVRAALYDVTARRDHRSESVRLAPGVPDASRRFAELADALLVGRGGGPSGDARVGTNVLAALRAYQRGHALLARWAVDSAAAAFREATAIDPEYAEAHLWLAQAQAWRLDDGRGAAARDPLRASALAAVTGAGALPPREAAHANALLALAEERFVDACARYRSLVRGDSTDVRAWFGLAECQSRDRVVVPDARSRTGWRFRASAHSAVEAYYRALALAPSFQLAFRGAAYARLSTLLVAQSRTVRSGVDSGGTRRFAAAPALDHDTLVFTPLPIEAVARAPERLHDATEDAAVARGRQRLLALMRGWASAMPRSPDALEGYALALETQRALDGPDGALATVRRARTLPAPEAQSLALATSEVRLLVKLGRHADAGRLADSVLAAHPADALEPASAKSLAGLAAYTGHTRRYVALQLAAGPLVAATAQEQNGPAPPPPLVDASVILQGYAAHGAPAESIDAAAARAARLAIAWAGADPARTRVVDGMFYTPLLLAAPVVGRRAFWRPPPPGSAIRVLQFAHLTNDPRSLAHADSILQASLPQQLADRLPLETILARALVLVARGRDADAEGLLAAALDNLPAMGANAFTQEALAAATLGRVLALRVELAARRGDHAAARRWAAALAAAWGHADPALAPILARTRHLTGER